MTNYLKDSFRKELNGVTTSTKSSISDRLSVVHLVPQKTSHGPNADHAEAIAALANKRQFLFCYFIVSLVDQSTHSRFPSFHHTFEADQHVPKICGILGSYWNILHPTYALAAASLWPSATGDTESLESISTYFWTVYFDQMLSRFTTIALSNDHRLNEPKIKAAIMEEMLSACRCPVSSLRPYSKSEPNLIEIKEMIACFERNAKWRMVL